VTQKTDARGIVSTYTYDALNRLKTITYPANTGENVSFSYDDTVNTYFRKGRLGSVFADGGTLVLSYDAYGNITQRSDLNGLTWSSTYYRYDSANRLNRIIYPSGRSVLYTRNSLGQITQVQTQDSSSAPLQTMVSNVSYEPFGPLKSLTFGNGVTTMIQHDADYRLARITTSAQPLWDFQYSYDAAGNLQGTVDLGPDTDDSKSYGYDNLNRVISDSNAFGLTTYQYDAGSNRTLRQPPWPLAAITQQYAASSNRATGYNGGAMTLDAAGNVALRSTVSASYNSANRLKQTVKGSVTATYAYNGLGQRTTKLGALKVHYDALPDGKTLGQLQLNANNSYNQGMEYIWLDDLPIAQIKTTYNPDDNTPTARRLTYIHADSLNTPRLMTDSTKTVVWRWSSDAYGVVNPNANPDGDSVIDTLDLRFPGQIADSESGLFYNQNRYYDPLTGRYTQSDPIGLQGGLNAYAYVNGNPINYIDPTGKIGVVGAAVIAVGAIGTASAIYEVYKAYEQCMHTRDKYNECAKKMESIDPNKDLDKWHDAAIRTHYLEQDIIQDCGALFGKAMANLYMDIWGRVPDHL
jgi:RHS repeat-associated protein